MQRVAQDWLVLQLTSGSGSALGITTGLQFLPVLLLSPYAGVIADRFPKRRLLQLTQAVMAGASLLLGLITVTGVVEVWHVYVLAFVFGIGSAFDAPARQSFVSEMVEHDEVTNAVGLNSAAFNLARILGPGLAGLMIGALGGGARATGWVILINAVSYAAVITQLQRMDTDLLHTPEPVARTPGMLLDGVRYVRSQPKMLMVLVLVFFAGTFGMNFQITSALMATEVFDKGASEFGLLGSFMAIGSLAGALMAARRSTIRVRLLVVAALGFGAAEIAAGLMPSYVLFAAMCPVIGFCTHDPAQLRQRDHAAGVRPGLPGPGDGAVHDDRDGRHADRLAGHRLGRGDLRRPLDPDHGRGAGDRRRGPGQQPAAAQQRPAPTGCADDGARSSSRPTTSRPASLTQVRHRFDPLWRARVISILVSGTTRPLRVPANRSSLRSSSGARPSQAHQYEQHDRARQGAGH